VRYPYALVRGVRVLTKIFLLVLAAGLFIVAAGIVYAGIEFRRGARVARHQAEIAQRDWR